MACTPIGELLKSKLVSLHHGLHHQVKGRLGAQFLGHLELVVAGRRGRYDVLLQLSEGARMYEEHPRLADGAHVAVVVVELVLFA